MLIVINGTIGVGKTWIARYLLCQLKEAAYVEGDTMGFVSKDLLQTKSRSQFALEIAFDLIASFRRKGAKTIVFDGLISDASQLKSFVREVGEPVAIFYLSASPKTLAYRIRARGRPQAEREIEEAVSTEKIQRESFAPAELGYEIMTDNLSPENIVEEILKRLPV